MINPSGVKKCKFVTAVLEGKSSKDAAIAAGYARTRAEVTGSELMHHPDIQATIRLELERRGLGPMRVLDELEAGLGAQRYGSHDAYLGKLMRLWGLLTPEVIVATPPLTSEEIGRNKVESYREFCRQYFEEKSKQKQLEK